MHRGCTPTFVLTAHQGAVELSDEGATFMAEGFQLLQGPSEAPMSAAQCKWADLDLIVSFWLVRPEYSADSCLACSTAARGIDHVGDGLQSLRALLASAACMGAH